MTITLPLLVAVFGILLWACPYYPKVSEAGRIMFFCGLFIFLFRK